MYSFTFLIAFSAFILGYYYYYKFILRHNEKNPLPWILWSFIGFDILVDICMSNNSSEIELLVNSAFFFGPAVIALQLTIIKKEKYSFSKPEKIFGFIVLLFLLIVIFIRKYNINDIDYYLTIASIILEFLVIYPLLLDIYKNPYDEDIKPWLYWTISEIFGLITIYGSSKASFIGTGVLWYILLVTSTVTIYIYIKKLKKVRV